MVYERMRGEYQLQKMKQKDLGKIKNHLLMSYLHHMKFTKEELAKYLMCWDFRNLISVIGVHRKILYSLCVT